MERSNIEDDYIEIANEFAVARVRKVHTRNGERLEISAPKQESKILLDPLQLESLTWQTPETFAKFLTEPFGPETEYE
jgi:DNA polymerase I-like protein with 3'-5' exonuclease and polymerase domains